MEREKFKGLQNLKSRLSSLANVFGFRFSDEDLYRGYFLDSQASYRPQLQLLHFDTHLARI